MIYVMICYKFVILIITLRLSAMVQMKSLSAPDEPFENIYYVSVSQFHCLVSGSAFFILYSLLYIDHGTQSSSV